MHLPGTMPDERHFLERAHPVAAAKTRSCKAPDCFETGIRLSVRPCPVEMVLLSKDSLDEIPTVW